MPRTFYGRLPGSYEVTTDTNKYCDAWGDIAEKLQKIFTGYKCDAYDPDWSLTLFGKNGLGVTVVKDRIVVSYTAAQILFDKFGINTLERVVKGDK